MTEFKRDVLQDRTGQDRTGQDRTGQDRTGQDNYIQEGVPNWANKTIFTGDNLPIMRRMNSRSVDLIYLDPPFNSNANYAAPIGSEAAGAEFKDTWTLTDLELEWLDLLKAKHPALNRVIHAVITKSDKSYMIYMAVRLIEMHRILKDTGSIYLHCDPTMSHYLKILMDAVFERKNFRREIVWQMKSVSGFKSKAKNWIRDHDILLFFSKSEDYTFNIQKQSYSKEYIQKMFRWQDSDGRKYRQRKYGEGIKKYYADEGGVPFGSVFTDINSFQTATRSKEITGYPTQKPVALCERIIKASSNEGGIIFDPFCGCATTCVAAELCGRQWVGIDISPLAGILVVDRLQKLKDRLPLFKEGEIIHRKDLPQRTDMGSIPRYDSYENKSRLYGEQGGYCNGCETHFKKENLTVDHIIAISKGGVDHIDNLQLLCGRCNSIKGNRGMEYLNSKLS